MGFFDKILGSAFGNLIDNVAGTVDRFITTGDEANKFKLAINEQLNSFKLQLLNSSNDYEKLLTERHKIDMQSDSKLSKNIRPLSMVFTTLMVTIFAITDGNLKVGEFAFSINGAYVKLLESLMIMQYTFYFGGRSIEKIIKVGKGLKGSKENK